MRTGAFNSGADGNMHLPGRHQQYLVDQNCCTPSAVCISMGVQLSESLGFRNLHMPGEDAQDAMYWIASQDQGEAKIDEGQVEGLHRKQTIKRDLGSGEILAPHVEDHFHQCIAQKDRGEPGDQSQRLPCQLYVSERPEAV